MSHLVFVYGTLRQGQRLNGAMATSQLVDMAYTAEAMTLRVAYGGRGIPFLCPAGPGARPVRGDVYAVDDQTLVALDRIEGHPHFYTRERIKIDCDDLERVEAWAYLYRHPGYAEDVVSTTGDYVADITALEVAQP